jgi:hypothetical protein
MTDSAASVMHATHSRGLRVEYLINSTPYILVQVRFTLSVSSDEEVEELIMRLRANPEIEPKALNMQS